MLADFCTLPDAELAARQEHLRETLLPKTLHSDRTATGHVVEFDAQHRGELDELVDFERRCCPGIGWSVEQAGDRVRLVIEGI